MAQLRLNSPEPLCAREHSSIRQKSNDLLLTPVFETIDYEKIVPRTYGQKTDLALHNFTRHGNFAIAGGFPSIVIFGAARENSPIRQSPEQAEHLQENYLE